MMAFVHLCAAFLIVPLSILGLPMCACGSQPAQHVWVDRPGRVEEGVVVVRDAIDSNGALAAADFLSWENWWLN